MKITPDKGKQVPVATVLGLVVLVAAMTMFAVVTDLATRHMPDVYPLVFGGAVALGLACRLMLIRYQGWHHNDLIFGFCIMVIATLFFTPGVALPLVLSDYGLATFEVASAIVCGVAAALVFLTGLLGGLMPRSKQAPVV